MSQYFLISSAYRDRLLYPNPGKFVVPFGANNNINANVFNVFTTTNPVTKAFPNYNCAWTNFKSEKPFIFNTTLIGGTSTSPIVSYNVNTDLIGINTEPLPTDLFYLKQPLEQSFDILKSFLFFITLDNVEYVRVIEAYDPIKAQITLLEPIPSFNLQNGPIPCKIVHPLFDTKSEEINSVVINGPFLTDSNFTSIDFEFYIYNLTLNEIRKAQSFSSSLSRVFLDNAFSSGAKVTDQYQVITKIQPSALGKITLFPNQKFYIHLPETLYWHNQGKNWTVNQIVVLKTTEEQNKPESYFHKYKIVRVSPLGEIQDLEIYDLGTQDYELNKIYNVILASQVHDTQVHSQFAILSITSFSIVFQLVFNQKYQNQLNLVGNYFLPVIQSQQYGYNGDKITLQSTNTISPDIVSTNNNSNENTNFDLLESQTTCGVTGIKRFTRLSNGDILIYTQNYTNLIKLDLLSKHFNKVPANFQGIDNFLILPFFNEGVVPLNFTGTQLTQTQMSCYEMSITNLILPNRILAVGDGLLTSSYPFVFVSITNENNPNGGSYNRFFSNNPFATKALFICSISDVNNPETTKFIKISSDGAVQTVKFSPIDSLGFEVSLPNGIAFQTEDTDYIVPLEPNPLLQITLFVQVKKIE